MGITVETGGVDQYIPAFLSLSLFCDAWMLFQVFQVIIAPQIKVWKHDYEQKKK